MVLFDIFSQSKTYFHATFYPTNVLTFLITSFTEMVITAAFLSIKSILKFYTGSNWLLFVAHQALAMVKVSSNGLSWKWRLKPHFLWSTFPQKQSLSRLAYEICAMRLMQADTQANQFASATDCEGNITNFLSKIVQEKVSFSISRLKGDLFLNFFVCHKKRYNQENTQFVKTCTCS